MPSARASEFRRAAAKLGFEQQRQVGRHERWKQPDGRSTTSPIHGSREIGSGLYHLILEQLGIDEKQFRKLR